LGKNNPITPKQPKTNFAKHTDETAAKIAQMMLVLSRENYSRANTMMRASTMTPNSAGLFQQVHFFAIAWRK
jgi:hypothetical protein